MLTPSWWPSATALVTGESAPLSQLLAGGAFPGLLLCANVRKGQAKWGWVTELLRFVITLNQSRQNCGSKCSLSTEKARTKVSPGHVWRVLQALWPLRLPTAGSKLERCGRSDVNRDGPGGRCTCDRPSSSCKGVKKKKNPLTSKKMSISASCMHYQRWA